MTPFKNTSATQPSSRNPLLWPFSSDSIWNAPIGANAKYVDAKIQPAKFLSTDIDHFFALKGTDPKRDVYNIGSWTDRTSGNRDLGFDLPLPNELLIKDANEIERPNNSAALLMPDGETLMQLNAMTRDRVGSSVNGVKYPFGNRPNETLTGSGALGGHGGSGLSSIGGTLRLGELVGDEPIRHALKLNLWAKRYLSYSDGVLGGRGYRWPAIKADSYANGTTYGGKVPALTMGSLLAIPPSLTPESLGLKTQPAKKLFYALQDYGAYVADDTAWDSHALEIENGVLQEFRHEYGYNFRSGSGDFYDDVMSLFSSLNVVDNNGPGTIGGGGTPRAPLAPPIDSNSVEQLQQLMMDPTVEDTFRADFNGDGHTDLLWRNLASGATQVWLQDAQGQQVGGGNILPMTDPNWQIKATPDTDRDGDADIVWQNRANGAEQVWHLDDIRMWVDPSTGRHINRWMETASGSPRIEFTQSGLTPPPQTEVIDPPQPSPSSPGGGAALPNPDAIRPPASGANPANGNGNGLTATYFNERNLTQPGLTRTDPTIDFKWGQGAPDQAIAPDTFSARWTGQIQPRYSETYEFTTRSDDGIRVWIDGQKIIDNWTMHAPTDNTGTITLEAGQKYDIQIEYFENLQGASLQLSWASLSQIKEIVPQSQLYSASAPSSPVPLSANAPSEPPTMPIPPNLSVEPFDLTSLQSYAPQKHDKLSKVTFSNTGKAVRIRGNAWKSLPINYDITPDTQLLVEFRSNKEGDIHAIGFDTNQKLDGGEKARSFKLEGTQRWGNRDFDDYVTKSGWKTYAIPVGDYFTGDMDHLLLINDHDVKKPNAISEFRNIELFELGVDNSDNSKTGAGSLLSNSGLLGADVLFVDTSGF